jgi:hypothetical protein
MHDIDPIRWLALALQIAHAGSSIPRSFVRLKGRNTSMTLSIVPGGAARA